MKVKMGQKCLNDYEINLKSPKRGAFGEILRATDKTNLQQVALKQINIQTQNVGIPSNTIREIALLRELQDVQYIVKLKDVLLERSNAYLVFNFYEKDLKDYIQGFRLSSKLMPSQTVRKLLRQLLLGIEVCHLKRIIHRDLKPANILMDENEDIKIADFGLARTFMIPIRPYSQEVVTLWYRAPQILLGSREYTTPIDIWSIGCIFAEMVTGRSLFAGENQLSQLHRIFRVLGTPTEQTWPGVTNLKKYDHSFPSWPPNLIKNFSNLNLDNKGIDLLMSMLVYNPVSRITAKDALNHPYFNFNFNFKD